MSIQDMEDLKQQYLDEMKTIINQIQIEDYHNERIDIHYRRECEIKIDELKTIPEKESNKFIKSSVEDLIPIPSEFEDTSNCECDLPFYGNSVTFSNPLFDSNDDFTSSDDDSLSDEDVPEDNVKIHTNPLIEFDDEYISSDVNPLFYEVLDDIKNKYSYVSNLDEPDLFFTPLSISNEDECFDPGNDIELLLHRDPSTPKMSVTFILEGFTNEPLL
nr:hypothetical protein [Tanacetum cinerariifolium]